ncbi:MAG: hypothetical protein GY801_41245 [bacterium]|nr:hypothetical protein [bacterium]
MYESGSAWTRKGATLSDKSARKEFGLFQEDIIEAIKQGKLQYRQNAMHGNPYFRLLRDEVEALVKEKFGQDYLQKKQLKNELSQINRDLRKLKKQITSLEKRKKVLLTELDE